MKKVFISLILGIAVLIQIFPVGLNAEDYVKKKADEEMRGVWVASVFNIDYPKTRTTNPLFLKREADLIIEQAYQTGLNAIFFQVRPTSDAFYKSDIFPWSKWLTGREGLAPDDGFDPLQYFIEKAHAKGIQVHAWLNPYRISKKASGEPAPTVQSLADGHPAKLHPELVVSHGGDLYYDPALPEVRKLIADGAKEIVEKYDVDGIHFDDYFYPGTDFNDNNSYKNYGGGMNKADWRRENVNKMVKEVRDAIKAVDPNVQFGISPFGIWKNKSSSDKTNPYGIEGSATNGNQSYTAHYADSVHWVKTGLIDYINPQIYWHRGFSIADYNVLSSWWANVVKGTNVKLYVGHAAYRSGSTETDSPWYGPYEILEQVLLNKKIPEIKGSIFFSMTSLQKQPELRDRLAILYGVKEYRNDIKYGIHLPSSDMTTLMGSHYIGGASDPTKPLFINGKKIENRSVNGFFGTLVELKYGRNEIIMENGDNRYVRVINRGGGSSDNSGNNLKSIEIVQESCYPKTQAVVRDYGSMTLECTAPSGASVFAEIAGYKVPMERVWGGSEYSLAPAKYRGTFKPIQFFEHVEMYDYGKVTYHMYYDGKTDSKTSSGELLYVSKDSKIYGKVVKDEIDLRITKNPGEGSAEILDNGVIEEVVSSDGDMTLLASGRYTESDNLTLTYSIGNSSHHVGFDEYSLGDKEDVISLKLEDNYAMIPKLNKGSVDVQVAAAGSMDKVTVPKEAMVSNSMASVKNGRGFYSFVLKDSNKYNGAYVTYDGGKGFIHLRKRPHIVSGDKPLSGITIMLDAGHGESDTGAIGLMGLMYPEKAYALDACNSLMRELEKLGANVVMTRKTDGDVSLQDRLRMSYRQKPDMFISIHANSIGMHRNIAEIEGFSVYYSKNLALPFAEILQTGVVEKLGRNDRNKLTDDFYVIRGTWTPSVLIETGFMPNPNDFDWLYDSEKQKLFISQIVESILVYFNDGRR